MHKYQSLLNALEQLIQTEQIKEGEKLPSIRILSKQYQCSKTTVIKALQELEKRHQIYSVPKSGYYVVKKDFDFPSPPSDHIDFATSTPAWNQFPYLDFQHCINQAIHSYQQDLFVYGTPKGLPSLIEMMQKHLETDQVFTKKENIVITSGVQQALFLLTLLPFPNHQSKIAVEQPSYHLFMEHFNTHQIPAVGIRRTSKGIDLEELEKVFSKGDIKFFYTMPRFHNPLGTSYSRKEKEAIVKLAEQYDVYIVEDDYLADFEQDSKIDPLFSYLPNDRIIYLKSFSKIIFPGLRVGVAVLPRILVESFQQYKKIADIDSSMISQAALEIYMKSGMFERHRDRVHRSYLSRANTLYQELERHAPTDLKADAFHRPSSLCMNVHMVLPRTIIVNKLIKRLKQQNVWVDPIHRHYLQTFPQDKILKLHVFNVNESQIKQGVHLIVKEINHRGNYV
ncbi:PLP-dependent aminotransferase family protein [Melghirimyces algeriensis]|uniref:Transcriptional regulator, GntR family n=1 Tax=Melghirimyces algeriensis TaxID=910412 RepID=A0A521EWX4_9BACL|nr:PLP-dependent aminotransferase family protein [Melghirimyces algeriensis]SMO88417.1 transcriptional regulator, GntR family [Melghirimyces algeriensis]